MTDPVSYTDFPYSNTSAPSAPGPWTIHTSPGDYVYCQPHTQERCRGRAYCLACYVSPPDPTDLSYNVLFTTNLSVDLAQYGGKSSLAYTWEYWAWWESLSPTGDRIEMQISSSVGDDVYTDQPSFIYTPTGGGPSMTGDKFYRHNGVVEGLLTSADQTVGYLPISINHTFPHKAGEYMGYSVRAVYLGLSPPPATSTGVEPIATASTSLASASTPPSTSSSSPPPKNDTVPIGAAVGASLGSAALVALLAVAFILYRTRRAKTHGSEMVPPLLLGNGGNQVSAGSNQPQMARTSQDPVTTRPVNPVAVSAQYTIVANQQRF
ncbi:hypothetical protein FRC17_003052 [Serendipita sp. 399]|nr:hypothetical protein FRC17_003052 [Serendipita sp. 399]